MNKLFAALVAVAFAFASSAMAQDKTPEPVVKAPTKAERAAMKADKAKMKAAGEDKTVSQAKAEKKAKAQMKLQDSAAISKQGDQSPKPMSDTTKTGAKPTKAERQQDASTMQKNAGKAGQ